MKKKLTATFAAADDLQPHHPDFLLLLLGNKGSLLGTEVIALVVKAVVKELSKHKKTTDVIHKMLKIISSASVVSLVFYF